ncbi:MAG: serine/threonine dehydratase [Gammaproteobacteria bacterium]|nr:serine/threonine dehydratase [Gammaproteobacteria bacterium]
MRVEPLCPDAVAQAASRIRPYITQTPLLKSGLLDGWLGHHIVFKVEGLQKIGAFKVRGALNTLLALKEQRRLPEQVVAFSSGNHAQAVAYAARLLDVRATVLIPRDASAVKRQATEAYGARVIVTDDRNEAESRINEFTTKGAFLLHPYDSDSVIAGQGTACYEALQTGLKPDAIFATCGGGGWLSGTFLAAGLSAPETPVFGAEPKQANDAAQSLRRGEIVHLTESPDTIADGARTLSVSARTFHYLRQLAGFYEIDERDIVYWTQWLIHLLKTTVEPTSAVAMAGAFEWLKHEPEPRNVLVMLSGGNIAASTQARVWATDQLATPPRVR